MTTDIDKLLKRLESLDHITQGDGLEALIKTCYASAKAIRELRKRCEEWNDVVAEILSTVRQKDHLRYMQSEGMDSEQAAIHAQVRYQENLSYINRRMSAYRTFTGEKG